MKILANDGIHEGGKIALESVGFEVITTKVAQEQLENFVNENSIDALIVKNTTQVHSEFIDACPSIKLIAHEGTGIDVDYAQESGIQVINSAESSSKSVAELVFAHLFGMVRFLHQANRDMPLEGELRFKALKRQYANGIELRGKTLGIIGMGSVGQEVAKIALGIGMKVIASDNEIEKSFINLPFYNGQSIDFEIDSDPISEVLKEADFITLHAPSQEDYVIGTTEFEKMKDGVGIINVSRGGLLDEVALVNAIDNGKVKYAGLDVYENEPTPEIQLLMNPEISLTPHIGASTLEAKERIGKDQAKQIIDLLSE